MEQPNFCVYCRVCDRIHGSKVTWDFTVGSELRYMPPIVSFCDQNINLHCVLQCTLKTWQHNFSQKILREYCVPTLRCTIFCCSLKTFFKTYSMSIRSLKKLSGSLRNVHGTANDSLSKGEQINNIYHISFQKCIYQTNNALWQITCVFHVFLHIVSASMDQ